MMQIVQTADNVLLAPLAVGDVPPGLICNGEARPESNSSSGRRDAALHSITI